MWPVWDILLWAFSPLTNRNHSLFLFALTTILVPHPTVMWSFICFCYIYYISMCLLSFTCIIILSPLFFPISCSKFWTPSPPSHIVTLWYCDADPDQCSFTPHINAIKQEFETTMWNWNTEIQRITNKYTLPSLQQIWEWLQPQLLQWDININYNYRTRYIVYSFYK